MRFDRRLFGLFDWFALVAMLALIGVGFVIIASAAHTLPGGERSYLIKQGAAVVLGLLSWVVLIGFDYQDFAKWGRELYLITIGMLVAVMLAGHSSLGAQRWIKLGPIEFQPSEPAKLLLIVGLAAFLANREPLTRWRDLIAPGLYLALPLALILRQPDLGTALVLVSVAAAMCYMAGAPGWRILLLLVLGIGAICFWIYANIHWDIWIPLKPYQITRLIIFLDPMMDPSDTGYHVIQSRIAIGSGSLWGKGWFNGTQTQLGFLPEGHTDFIFAVLCEEFGFVGGAITLAVAGILMMRLMVSGINVEDRFGRLIIAGVVGMLLFQFLENTGMTMGVMPVTGIPLPFVSYGPSAMLSHLAAVGLALGVIMRRKSLIF